MRDLMELGLKKYGNRPFPPFSDAQLREFEASFGVKLPADYISFLRFANGGTSRLSVYDDPAMEWGEINDFYGLGRREGDEAAAKEGKWETGNLWGETRAFKIHLQQDRAVPFGRDGGGNRLFINFRQADCGVSRLIVATRKDYRIAASFEEFIDMLRAP